MQTDYLTTYFIFCPLPKRTHVEKGGVNLITWLLASSAEIKIMASLTDDGIEILRPAETKYTKSPKSKSSSVRHKTRTPTDAFRQSEQSLRELLEDFESGRLNAFGKSVIIVTSHVRYTAPGFILICLLLTLTPSSLPYPSPLY